MTNPLTDHLADLATDRLLERLPKMPKRALLRSERRAAAQAETTVAPVKTVPSTLDHVLLTSYTYFDDDGYGGTGEFLGKAPTNDIEQAEMVSSHLVDRPGQTGLHAPVLRLRFPRHIKVHEDRDYRRHVLTIDKPMSGWRYGRLLKALHKAGLVSTDRSRILNSDRLDRATFNLIVPAALSTSLGQDRSHGDTYTNLYLDAPMTWRTYKRLMKALVAADIIGSFWVKSAIRRGETRVEVPWPITADHSAFCL